MRSYIEQDTCTTAGCCARGVVYILAFQFGHGIYHPLIPIKTQLPGLRGVAQVAIVITVFVDSPVFTVSQPQTSTAP